MISLYIILYPQSQYEILCGVDLSTAKGILMDRQEQNPQAKLARIVLLEDHSLKELMVDIDPSKVFNFFVTMPGIVHPTACWFPYSFRFVEMIDFFKSRIIIHSPQAELWLEVVVK